MGKRKIQIGDIFKDEKRDLTVIDIKSETKNGLTKRKFKYRCNICGYEDWKDNMTRGCRLCTNQIIIKGINDIATSEPWMMKYLTNQNDAYKYAKTSKVRVSVTCPDCGKTKTVELCNLYKMKKVSCSCQDTWSYPNKFMYQLLKQLHVDFETEKIFDWSCGKRYDDYITYDNKTIIIENHGKQHYSEYQIGYNQSLLEQIENDAFKEKTAKENGIDYYVVLDCRESNLDYIKNSIMSSILPNILNFSEDDINWEECEKFAYSNLIKQICNYKRDHPDCPTTQMTHIFKLTKECIGNYLKKGRKYGWCEYNPTEEKVRERHKHGTASNPIYNITTDEYFRDSEECQRHYTEIGQKIFASNIRKVLRGERNQTGGFTFKYISKSEFNRIKRETPEKAFGDFFISEKENIS